MGHMVSLPGATPVLQALFHQNRKHKQAWEQVSAVRRSGTLAGRKGAGVYGEILSNILHV